MIQQDEYRNLLNIGISTLKDSDTTLDRGLYKYFRALDQQASGDDIARGVDLGRPTDVLQQVIVEVDQAQRQESGRLRKGVTSLPSFFLTYLAELRKLICGNRKTPTKIGTNTHALISGIAAFTTSKLGVSNPTAIGIAVLILLTLAQATKNTFCKMTDIEAYKAIREHAEKK